MSKRKSDVKEQTPEVTVPASGSDSEATKFEKEEDKTKAHTCGECKFYDHSTEREFHRNGIREGLIEVRAVCKASKERTKASKHLVKRESSRPCFEAGIYVVPVKEKKKETKETPVEHKTSKKRDRTRSAVATNGLSGDAKVLEHNCHDKKALVKNTA